MNAIIKDGVREREREMSEQTKPFQMLPNISIFIF